MDLKEIHKAVTDAYRAGANLPPLNFAERVQDIAHQLLAMDNDNDEQTKVERLRLMRELVRIADAKVNAH